MALDRNKTGIMAAIQAATDGVAPINKPSNTRAHRALPKGTVGSVRAGLGGIQEIATDLILDWGPIDRIELTAVNSGDDDVLDIVESIKTSGQQVPVLLRPAPDRDGAFEVIYGRRRIHACSVLGIPVKALIRTLDDQEALMAKGLENSSRQELSFYERARFAKDILAQGFSRAEVQQALSISKASLSQLERVARLIPDVTGYQIGPAHGAGRPKWMALAAAFDEGRATEASIGEVLMDLPSDMPSDDRLAAVLASLEGAPTKRGAQQVRAVERSPVAGASVKTTKSSVTLTVKRAGESKEFATWFDENIDQLLKDSYQAFKNRSGG